jgi:hypothetical protein
MAVISRPEQEKNSKKASTRKQGALLLLTTPGLLTVLRQKQQGCLRSIKAEKREVSFVGDPDVFGPPGSGSTSQR